MFNICCKYWEQDKNTFNSLFCWIIVFTSSWRLSTNSFSENIVHISTSLSSIWFEEILCLSIIWFWEICDLFMTQLRSHDDKIKYAPHFNIFSKLKLDIKFDLK